MKLSQLRPYSIGIAAENKELKATTLEVTPIEDLSMLDGEINSDKTKETVSSQDSEGAAYDVATSSANSVKAEWLPMGSSNRLTPPDVRRGESIVLWRFADSDKFFWMTLKDDMRLRKLETAVYAWSGTKDENAKMGGDTYYFFEISTHRGLVHFHTTKSNGEPFGYDVQINTKDGFIKFQDDAGNFFILDSKEKQVAMQNVDGCSFEILKKNMTITVPDTYTINARNVIENVTEALKTSAGNSIETSTKNHTTKANSLKEQATTVDIQGSATVKITGGTVSIN